MKTKRPLPDYFTLDDTGKRGIVVGTPYGEILMSPKELTRLIGMIPEGCGIENTRDLGDVCLVAGFKTLRRHHTARLHTLLRQMMDELEK
jgi:hypothetical protein